MLSRSLVASLVTVVGVAGASAQEPPAVTLSEAIRRAERAQPAMIRASADVRTAGAQRRSALGAYLPRITAASSGSAFFSEGPIGRSKCFLFANSRRQFHAC